MLSKTQKQFVLNELSTRGYITRNFCLKNYISRLGAIICELKKEGYVIEAKNLKTALGIDYIYHLKGTSALLIQQEKFNDEVYKVDRFENSKQDKLFNIPITIIN